MKHWLYSCIAAGCVIASCSTHAEQAERTAAPPASPRPARATVAAQARQMPKGSNVNPDAGLLAEFTKKVNAYVKLRNDAAGAAPALKKTEKPAEIAAAEKSMAQIVRAARADAKRGDIFTPATQAMFRRLLRPPLTKGEEGAENKAIMKDDAPEPKDIPFKVNADYPKDAPLSTVAPDVLLTLPRLPEDVQYRFAGKHLLLYDAKANLIIDFMLNALP